MEHIGNFELFRTIADLILVPAMGVLWSMNGKINKMEAQISFLIELNRGE